MDNTIQNSQEQNQDNKTQKSKSVLFKVLFVDFEVIIVWVLTASLLGYLFHFLFGFVWLFLEGDGGGLFSSVSGFLLQIVLGNSVFYGIWFIVISFLFFRFLKLKKQWSKGHLKSLAVSFLIILVIFILFHPYISEFIPKIIRMQL